MVMLEFEATSQGSLCREITFGPVSGRPSVFYMSVTILVHSSYASQLPRYPQYHHRNRSFKHTVHHVGPPGYVEEPPKES